MAIGQLPPWLDVQPSQFLSALEAGSRVGMGLAQMRSQEAQANADRLARRDALAQEMAMKQLAEQEAERQFQQKMGMESDQFRQKMDLESAQLGQLENYRMGKEAVDREAIGQRMAAAQLADKRQRDLAAEDAVYKQLNLEIQQARLDNDLQRVADLKAYQDAIIASRNRGRPTANTVFNRNARGDIVGQTTTYVSPDQAGASIPTWNMKTRFGKVAPAVSTAVADVWKEDTE